MNAHEKGIGNKKCIKSSQNTSRTQIYTKTTTFNLEDDKKMN